MLEGRRILFPVDLSERCSAVASQVAALARKFDAKVTLLHVIGTPRIRYGDLPPEELQELIDIQKLINERKVMLDAYLRQEFQDVPDIERVVDRGEPAHVIGGRFFRRLSGTRISDRFVYITSPDTSNKNRRGEWKEER
jgi:nucleotide-binding universal stress UspA family protein